MDTATPVTGVAVGSEAGTLAQVAVRHERRHAEVLAPAVRWVLEQAEVDPASLAGVAVGTGPGLFTGLRVGVSTAKALAQAWGLPMVAVPSLDLIGIEARGDEVLLCGDGALLYREAFEHLGEQSELGGLTQASPSAAALVELALPRMLREEFTSPLEVTPLYLRRPDIDPNVERRLAAAGSSEGGG
jgi:tRNA threonylcarbamoyladenosine biosynthesis protein TsaB